MLKILVAMDKNRLIGKEGRLPWHNKEDLKHFKETTLHQTILMGSTTFMNLPRKLHDRKILVITSNNDLRIDDENVKIVYNFFDVVKKYQHSDETLYVCGGALTYRYFLPYCDELIISYIDGEYEGDTYFPPFEQDFELKEEVNKETFVIRIYKKR